MKSILQNEQVQLRALEPTDLEVLYKWENDPAVWHVSSTQSPYSRKMIWQYLENYTGDFFASKELRLMMVENSTQTPIGTMDLFNFEPLSDRAEMGMLIAPEYRGKGFAGQALRLFLDYVGNHLNLHQVYACIEAENDICLELFAKNGFIKSGVLKDWVRENKSYHDAIMMQYLFE